MREILVFSPNVFQSYGHNSDYVSGLVGGFEKMGFSIRIVAYEGDHCLSTKNSAKIQTLKRDHFQNSRTHLGMLGNVIWGLNRFKHEKKLYEMLHGILADNDDIVIIFESFEYICLYAFLKKNRFNNQYCCIFHDTNFSFSQTSLIASVYKTFVKHMVRAIIRNSRCVFVHGSYMQKNLVALLKLKEFNCEKKVSVIPYGSQLPDYRKIADYNDSKAKLGLPADKRILLAFGTIRSDKQYDLLLDQFSQTEGWVLHIAGPEGDLTYGYLQNIIRGRSLDGKVFLSNKFVDALEQQTYFGASDLVVNIYADEIRHESGTAQLARAFLKPIIVAGPPDLVEYVHRNRIGWSLDGSVGNSLKSILNEFSCMDEKKRRRLYKSIETCSIERSWNKVTEKILSEISGR